MWKHTSSPYILKFNGVFYHNDLPAIVTPWMPHGNITEYLERHPDADRLHLVSLKVPPAPKIGSLRTLSLSASRCGQRSQVPPQLQYSTWGHQGGGSSDLEIFNREANLPPAKYPRLRLRSSQSRARRLRFHPRYHHLGETIGHRGRDRVLHGSRAPPPKQIRPRNGGSV